MNFYSKKQQNSAFFSQTCFFKIAHVFLSIFSFHLFPVMEDIAVLTLFYSLTTSYSNFSSFCKVWLFKGNIFGLHITSVKFDFSEYTSPALGMISLIYLSAGTSFLGFLQPTWCLEKSILPRRLKAAYFFSANELPSAYLSPLIFSRIFFLFISSDCYLFSFSIFLLKFI